MVLTFEEIGQVCRFCLCRESLMPLAEATSSAFTMEDVIRFTGVELTKNDGMPYSICGACCRIVTSSVHFRCACLRNNIIFKKLVAVLKKCVKDNAPAQGTAEGGTTNVNHGDSGTLPMAVGARSDTPVITLDDSDSGDCMPAANDSQMDENSEGGPEEFNPTLDDSDSNDSTPSLYSEMLQEASNFATKFGASNGKRSTENIVSTPPTSVLSEGAEKESAITPIEANPRTKLDDSDSNDSLPSLYGEVMAQSNKGKQAMSGNTQAATRATSATATIESSRMSQDESDSDDPLSSRYREASINEKNAMAGHTKAATRATSATTTMESGHVSLDDSDSDDPLSSRYREAMAHSINEKNAMAGYTKATTRATFATATIESNRRNKLDDSDSNDSLPSLYEEAMAQSKKAKKDMAGSTKVVKKAEKLKLCPLCGLMVACMKSHTQNRHNAGDKKFSCPHCPKAFVQRSFLNLHINTWHEKRIILTCAHCGKGFVNHNSHFYHLKNSHGESDVYECETCGKKWKSYDSYKKHLKEHSITTFPCPDCNKLFKTSRTLEKHQLRYHAS